MDRFKKLKKGKSIKCSSKNEGPLFITDVESFNENIKIKEILRNVKMNSSMRLKAPPGSKVMNNMDFNDEECFEESSETQNSMQILSATNPDVVVSNAEQEESETDSDNNTREANLENDTGNESNAVVEENKHSCNNLSTIEPLGTEQSTNSLQNNCDNIESDSAVKSNVNRIIPDGKTNEKIRDRKLSFDHTILSRREGLSQSELDLHSIGKSPLERKSSFFRKTMDSFVKNTTEMFKKQNKSLQRHVSMSVSLQSLNEKSLTSNDYREDSIQQVKDASEDSRTYLQLPTQISRSHSSLSSTIERPSSEQSVADSYAGSQPTLENPHSCSVHSLNEAYLKDTMPRAISMSSGLNSLFGHPRTKTARSNRVTWLANEGLTNYLRRIVQDEKTKEMQSWQSFQDFSCIPENEKYSQKPDNKGRRLSYQRAVSGEDPVMPMRHHPDSTLRRKDQIPEMCETRELSHYLAEYSRHGAPPLQGFEMAPIPEVAKVYIIWASGQNSFQDYLTGKTFPPQELGRIEAVKELIRTEAEHINHLTTITEVFVAAAHGLQANGKLLNIDTKKLFCNISDVLNASLCFWNICFMPMILKAIENQQPFNTDLMQDGFERIKDILSPYESYLIEQTKLLDYYKTMKNDAQFSLYLGWCYNHHDSYRLHLNDFIAKPFQRLTKYCLLLKRIREHTNEIRNANLLETMESNVRKYLKKINMSVRKNEESSKIKKLQISLKPTDSNLKDDLDDVFKLYSAIDLARPMLYCNPKHIRSLICEANLRFRDSNKEIEVRAILLTDIILICKIVTIKRNQYCKIIRPIYMNDKLVQIPKLIKNEVAALGYIVVDDLGSSSTCFVLSESSKDADGPNTLKIWENKVKEAKLTYELLIWAAQNPKKTITRAELDHIVDFLRIRARNDADESSIEHEAAERVAAIMHQNKVLQDYDPMQYISETTPEVVIGVAARLPRLHHRNHLIIQRTLPIRYSQPAPDSDSEYLTPRSPDDPDSETALKRVAVLPPSVAEGPPTITVRVVEGEVHYGGVSEFETPDAEAYDAESESCGGEACSGEASYDGDSTKQVTSADVRHEEARLLRPRNNVTTLMHSLPDLTVWPSTCNANSKTLKRADAFAHSVGKLTKMDHVRSQSPIQMEEASFNIQHAWADRGRGGSPQPGPST